MFKTIIFLCVFLSINPILATTTDKIANVLNLSIFIPITINAFMTVINSVHDYLIYDSSVLLISIWLIVGVFIIYYIFKMYCPPQWLFLLGLSGGGEIWENKTDTLKIIDVLIKPIFKAIIASILITQLKPVYIANFFIDPIIKFSVDYSHIIYNSNQTYSESCSKIKEQGWITEKTCQNLSLSLKDISKANLDIVSLGLTLVKSNTLTGTITGLFLIVSFLENILFTSFLIIQSIFNFFIQILLYPFNVIFWVYKTEEQAFNIFPIFKNIIDSLKKLILAIIGSAFIVLINYIFIKTITNWYKESLQNNNFIIICIYSILVSYLIYIVYNATKKELNKYTIEKNELLDNFKNDSKILINKIKQQLNKINAK